MEKVFMTKFGYEKLKNELEKLKKIDRPANIKAIEIARGHGDLSENADYSAAKEKQSFIEGRIDEINTKLANAEVVDTEKLSKDKVVFASTIVLENLDTEEEITYQIVGSDEVDIKLGKVSIDSPLGKAMLGKKVGDEVIVNAPGGKRIFELIEIK